MTTQGNAISSQGSAITSLNNSLNSLAVGSTNLLPGTDLSTHASKDGTFKNGNMISATATTAGSVDMLALKSTVELLAGEYVVSFGLKQKLQALCLMFISTTQILQHQVQHQMEQ